MPQKGQKEEKGKSSKFQIHSTVAKSGK